MGGLLFRISEVTQWVRAGERANLAQRLPRPAVSPRPLSGRESEREIERKRERERERESEKEREKHTEKERERDREKERARANTARCDFFRPSHSGSEVTSSSVSSARWS